MCAMSHVATDRLCSPRYAPKLSRQSRAGGWPFVLLHTGPQIFTSSPTYSTGHTPVGGQLLRGAGAHDPTRATIVSNGIQHTQPCGTGSLTEGDQTGESQTQNEDDGVRIYSSGLVQPDNGTIPGVGY